MRRSKTKDEEESSTEALTATTEFLVDKKHRNLNVPNHCTNQTCFITVGSRYEGVDEEKFSTG
jgi:hypothetical protein